MGLDRLSSPGVRPDPQVQLTHSAGYRHLAHLADEQPRGRAFEPDLPGAAREGQEPRTMVQNFPMTIRFVAW